ncbi:MAG: aldo/keto reductase [Streptosporangiales bacterium]|nr:aldo/keto reductase [Streptosporangiales bacterium]MBO0891929.1 aldo/keto reductase [Acidothermales bacterium]
MTQVPNVRLADGHDMPQVGFGVYKVPQDETVAAVRTALDAGYRGVDTAVLYRNEAEVGRAVAESGLPREELFVTTKLWNDRHGYDSALAAFDESLGRLGMDYVDLYMIHWPVASLDRYVETWRALLRLRDEGRARSVGVANFTEGYLQRLIDETGVTPVVNQVELHPYLNQPELRAYHERHGIVTEAWAPLARGGKLLADPVVTGIAERHGRMPAQVVLRWHLQHGDVVIPKSVTPERIRANIELFDFALDDDEMAALDGLDVGERTGNHPDNVGP